MEQKDQLRQIVAQLAGLTSDQIDPDFSLRSRGLQSSVRRAALAAAVRRHLGVSVPDVYSVVTFGDLEAAVFGDGSQKGSASPTPAVLSKPTTVSALRGFDDLACGIDIERVDAMPLADDYWEHEFYKESFSKDEIAYCLLQENPRMHFAARWCAKEALVKCDPSFKGHSFATLEVVRNESGELSLAYRVNSTSVEKPTHAVSISHTETTAAAIVIKRQK